MICLCEQKNKAKIEIHAPEKDCARFMLLAKIATLALL